jgi:hypothetical protein
VVVADRQGREVGVEVEDLAAGDGVDDPRAAGAVEVDGDVEAVGEDMLADQGVDAIGTGDKAVPARAYLSVGELEADGPAR